jgi:16S rRNA (cytosine967-C5)-methyltransferase
MSRDGGRTRAAAAKVVDGVLTGGRSFDRALREVVDESLPPRELSQVRALALGALRWHNRHIYIINELLERPLRARDSVLEALLSVGLFQLIHPRQPDYAAVSATVAATRRLNRARAAGFINAALRRFQREQESLVAAAMNTDEGRFVHPQWLIDCLRRDWPVHWQAIVDAALAHPPFWVRVNAQRVRRDEYALRLNDEVDMGTTTLPGFRDALRLDRSIDVNELPGFSDGLVSVQDAAAQLAADLVAPEPGMRVLDACAAPGGKAGHLLERCDGQLDLVAVDHDAERNRMLEENLVRLGYKARIETGDARQPDDWSRGESFDRILIDVPCSATGVIRRHPDIKFLRRAEDIPDFADRQRALLEKLWPLLKPRGRLLYATCSVLRIENASVICEFLKGHSDAREIRPLRGDVLKIINESEDPGYQLLPGSADTDGFYYALMERQA